MRTAHGRVRRAISAVAMGRAVVVVDEVAAQGYLMYAADAATPALLAFTVRHTSGYVRVALPAGDCERLDLPPVCQQPTASAATAAHRVAVDAVDVGTGISATDRARTIATLADADATAADFRRPGHVVPVLAGLHGVLGARAGGAEAAIDLAALAGRRPSGVLCELVSQRHPSTMADTDELSAFAATHRLPMVSIAEIAAYRRRLEPQVMRCAETALPAAAGSFRALGYRDVRDDGEHLAILAGPAGADSPMPLHVHIECLTGDVFGSTACRCGRDLNAAVAGMTTSGSGLIVYLRPPGMRTCGVFTDAAADAEWVSQTVAWILRDLGVYTVRLDDDAPELGLLIFGAIREHGLRVESYRPARSAAG
ncbi:riboflavin biosynthesis protein RibA [Mycolicibacterium anyangense]|uniref:3,4-dihydroxy-2-butanone-4-phosphate synthase n=1 Tax=Mycolicibacterium anyangense TaxID=1431246 RepID=A0A6N4W3Y8_9MYCO|nr:3,4-dihydroxy-2-butanone-4-phosphate synthase [Mycolicibacterium anyangense]BBZ74817.1 riboflavin biosynthesis protein RibA [Mycolicibacterium anyangense]